jgi:septum formation protein
LPADLNEQRQHQESPHDLARRLARAKARAVARPASVVVGSDQVAVLGDRVLGKPGSHERARRQLRQLRGQSVSFLTAVALLDTRRDVWRDHLDQTRVRFRQLRDAEIESYLAAEQPYDCAGAFKVEGLGISLFEEVSCSDPTALIGLPLIWLSQALTEVGFNPLSSSS